MIKEADEKNNETYGASNSIHMNTIFTMDNFLPSYTTYRSNWKQPIMRIANDRSHKNRQRAPPINPWLSPHTIPIHLERLAVAMTNSVRASAPSEFVVGQASAIEVYVRIKWA